MAERTPRPDDRTDPDGATEELVAYLDGELDPRAADAMATRLGLDPKLRAEADALQRAWDILDVLPRPQPSAAFMSRTVSQALPLPTVSTTVPVPTATGSVGGLFWGISAVVVLVAGLGGYAGRALLVPKGQEYEQISHDAALLHNLRLYRTVDDLEFARQLDDPALFGEED